MLNKLKELWVKSSEEGIKFPYAYDAEREEPSVTLLIMYLASVMTIVSLVALHFTDTFIASVTTISFWALTTIFYRLRNLDKAKIDLDDKSIELESLSAKEGNKNE